MIVILIKTVYPLKQCYFTAFSMETMFQLFTNSLRSNENNLIYFLKQLGNKGKRKFSTSRAVFSCNVLRGNKVNISFVNISLSVQSIPY